MKRKVRVKILPQGQSGLEVKLGSMSGRGTNGNRQFSLPTQIESSKYSQQPIEVNTTLKSVDREDANIEAERGEVVMTNMNGDNIPETYRVGGDRHYAGGTPLKVPEDSFIFSDTNKMKIKDEEILSLFGLSKKSKGGVTPADIAKKYDLNSYRKILADPNTDKLQRETAEMMIANYNIKLAKLAMAQESMKGFPQGIPQVAIPYLESSNFDPSGMFQTQTSDQGQQEQEGQDMGVARYGGLPRAQTGGFGPFGKSTLLNPEPLTSEEKKKQATLLAKVSVSNMFNNYNNRQAYGLSKFISGIGQGIPEFISGAVNLPGNIKDAFMESLIAPAMKTIEYAEAQKRADRESFAKKHALPKGANTNQKVIAPADTIKGLSEAEQAKLMGLQYGGLPQAKEGVSVKNGKYYFEDNKGVITEISQGNYNAYTAKNNIGDGKKKVVVSTGSKEPYIPTYDPTKPYAAKTVEGRITPTKRISDNPYKTVADWQEARKKRGLTNLQNNNSEAQTEAYEKADPYWKMMMWGTYGDTAKGNTKNKYSEWAPKTGSNGRINESFSDYKKRLQDAGIDPTKAQENTEALKGSFTDAKSGIREAFLLQQPEEDQPVVPTKITDPPKTQLAAAAIPQHLKAAPYDDNAPWWLQDIVKTAGAAGDFARVKKYNPWQATPNTYLPDPTFYDPTRELAANSEQANIQTQALGQFAGPQVLSARSSSIQGQAAKNAADILGKYNTMNVGVANDFSVQNANTLNQASQQKAAQDTGLYDKYTIVNQQFDNAKNMARQNLRQSYIDALTNRANTYNLNTLYPQFAANPMSGGMINAENLREFQAGKDQKDPVASQYEKYIQDYGQTTADKLMDWHFKGSK